jgi:hypothetical protein
MKKFRKDSNNQEDVGVYECMILDALLYQFDLKNVEVLNKPNSPYPE